MPSNGYTAAPRRGEEIKELLKRRVLILDGAMGTMIQSYGLDEAGYRGDRFRNVDSDLKGNNDILSLTQPEIVKEIHDSFLRAGADIVRRTHSTELRFRRLITLWNLLYMNLSLIHI